MTSDPNAPRDPEAPPIMGSWKRLYILVLVIHFALIAGFALLTRMLS